MERVGTRYSVFDASAMSPCDGGCLEVDSLGFVQAEALPPVNAIAGHLLGALLVVPALSTPSISALFARSAPRTWNPRTWPR
jgi:hypothetical protein